MTEHDDRRADDFLVTGGGLRGALADGVERDVLDETIVLETLSKGDRLHRYRIEELLGEGGMGQVFRAFDEELGRSVALKLLAPRLVRSRAARERLHAEARAVSALNHPNICTLFDIGEVRERPFLVFELVEGRTLREIAAQQQLSPLQALELTAQVAAALQRAHESGILHRDIKPANVVVTDEGVAKLLDFGIAKGLAGTDEQLALASATLTQTGQMPGTLAYMSPEQVRGQQLDERSDVFALGALLYELLAGRKAFPGATAGATLEAVLRHDPPSLRHLGHAPGVQRLVSKALSKSPDDRFSSAQEMADAIEEACERLRSESPRVDAWLRVSLATVAVVVTLAVLGFAVTEFFLGPETVPAGASVAVLGFESTDPASDGVVEFAVADEILNQLLTAESIAVRPFSRSNTETLAGRPSEELGRQLGAEVLIGGDVRRTGSRTVVAMEAIRARSGDLIWRETVRLPTEDLMALQEQVTRAVRDGLLPAFGLTRATPLAEPIDEDAYRLYLQARADLRDVEPNRSAIERLREAVSLDPRHAAAWLELGQRLRVDAFYYATAPIAPALEQEARRAFEEALNLQPELAAAESDLISLQLEGGELIPAFERARSLAERRPLLASAQVPLAIVLRYAGLVDQSAALCDRAEQLDGRDPILRQCGLTYLWTGQAEKSNQAASRSTSSTWKNERRARLAFMRGDRAEALLLWRTQVGTHLGLLDRTALVHCLSGNGSAGLEQEALNMEGIPDGEWKFYSAGLLAACGLQDQALVLLQDALESGYCVDPSAQTDPLLGSLAQGSEIEPLRRRSADCRLQIQERTNVQKREVS